MQPWPITFNDALDAQQRIRSYLSVTPMRHYAALDERVGNDIRVWVKHENHHPTNSFKVRNAFSALTALSNGERKFGVVAASRGNHGAGLAYAGALLNIPVVICVPHGNNPEKNATIKGLGATLIEAGSDYDESVEEAQRWVCERGLRMIHSTNEHAVIAGAATMTLEMLEQAPDVDAFVIAVGGGSQAVGAMTILRAMRPGMPIYGVQAEQASAIHDSWHAKKPISTLTASTIADGLATRHSYELTFAALREGLTGFITVSEAQIAEAIRILLCTTHNLAEGAGAAGLAGLFKLRQQLSGKQVAVVLSGANIDQKTLKNTLQCN